MRKLKNHIGLAALGAGGVTVAAAGGGLPLGTAAIAGLIIGISGGLGAMLSNPSGPRSASRVGPDGTLVRGPSGAMEWSPTYFVNTAGRIVPGNPDAAARERYMNADPLDPTATLGFLEAMERSDSASSVSSSKPLDYVGRVKRPVGPPQPRRTAPRAVCGDCVGNYCSGECMNRSSPNYQGLYNQQHLLMIEHAKTRFELESAPLPQASGWHWCARHGRSVDRRCLKCAQAAQNRAQARSRRQGA